MSFELMGRPTVLKSGDLIIWDPAKKNIHIERSGIVLNITGEGGLFEIGDITDIAFKSIALLVAASAGVGFTIISSNKYINLKPYYMLKK